MAVLTLLPNGSSAGLSSGGGGGGKRGVVDGWSPAAVRRHMRWLFSIRADELTGNGYAVTLTVRDCPPSHAAWARLLKNLSDWMRDNGMIRWHWVVEWQDRGVPHAHLWVYGPESINLAGHRVVAAWLRIAADYGPGMHGQKVEEIRSAYGWLRYLSKHAARGVHHYQRQGKPDGWEKTGRLWGKGGGWPVAEEIRADLDAPTFYQLRRLVQRYLIAQRRAQAIAYGRGGDAEKSRWAWRSVAWLRGSRKSGDWMMSHVRGFGDFVPMAVMVQLAVAAGWGGELLEEEPDGEG